MKSPLTTMRRRQDGSIDTDFYVALGNRERGRAIRALWGRVLGGARPERRRIAPAQPGQKRGTAAGG